MLPVLLLVATRSARGQSIDPDTCHLTALATNDNDIRIRGDLRPPGHPVSVPSPVASKLHALAKKLLEERNPAFRVELTCPELFPEIYRISQPRQRELYVAEIELGFEQGFFSLVLYDPATGSVTQNPPLIWSKWTQSFGAGDPLLKAPFVSSANLFQDGHPQIVVEEYVHNGNMYNGVIYHYFEVGTDLAFTRVLARETRVLATSDDGMFVRDLTQLSPTRIRLTTCEVPAKDSKQCKPIGYVILESTAPGKPFHAVERHPLDTRDSWGLVTFMDQSPGDDAFLRGGNPFYY